MQNLMSHKKDDITATLNEMGLRPITNDDELTYALTKIEEYWGSEPDTLEWKALEILSMLVENYENKHFSFETMEPVELLRAHMEATDRTQADLAALIGSRSRASEVLNRKRALTVDMIHKLSSEWHLPADTLVMPYQVVHAY